MKITTLILTQTEAGILKKHLNDSILADFNKRKLSTEISSANIVKEEQLPHDAVCLNSVVQLQEIASAQSFIFQIVLPALADFKKNKISVFAPIAIALLGYRQGARVEWEMPGGVQEFEILKVSQVGFNPAT